MLADLNADSWRGHLLQSSTQGAQPELPPAAGASILL